MATARFSLSPVNEKHDDPDLQLRAALSCSKQIGTSTFYPLRNQGCQTPSVYPNPLSSDANSRGVWMSPGKTHPAASRAPVHLAAPTPSRVARSWGASPRVLRWIREQGARCEWIDKPPARRPTTRVFRSKEKQRACSGLFTDGYQTRTKVDIYSCLLTDSTDKGRRDGIAGTRNAQKLDPICCQAHQAQNYGSD